MTSQYPLRIDPKLKLQIEVEAKKQKRSFNNLVEVILTQYMGDIQNREVCASSEIHKNGANNG